MDAVTHPRPNQWYSSSIKEVSTVYCRCWPIEPISASFDYRFSHFYDCWNVAGLKYTNVWTKHHSDVIMSAMASQITSLTHDCLPNRFKAQIKQNIKAPRHRPLCGEFTGDRRIPAQKAGNAENVSIWWRHRECGENTCSNIEPHVDEIVEPVPLPFACTCAIKMDTYHNKYCVIAAYCT